MLTFFVPGRSQKAGPKEAAVTAIISCRRTEGVSEKPARTGSARVGRHDPDEMVRLMDKGKEEYSQHEAVEAANIASVGRNENSTQGETN